EVARCDDEQRAAVRVPDRRGDGARGTRQRGVDERGVAVGHVHDDQLLRLVQQVPGAVDVEVQSGDEARGLGVRCRSAVAAR
ncbi:hypothetical protein COO01_31690, partial [Bacillus toyonensis]